MGPDGGFRGTFIAPGSSLHLHLGLIIWVHHGFRTHVWDPV